MNGQRTYPKVNTSRTQASFLVILLFNNELKVRITSRVGTPQCEGMKIRWNGEKFCPGQTMSKNTTI